MESDDPHHVYGYGKQDEDEFETDEYDLMQLADYFLSKITSFSSSLDSNFCNSSSMICLAFP